MLSFPVFPDPFCFTWSPLLNEWFSWDWWCGWGFLDNYHVLGEGLVLLFQYFLLRFPVQSWVVPSIAPWFCDLEWHFLFGICDIVYLKVDHLIKSFFVLTVAFFACDFERV